MTGLFTKAENTQSLVRNERQFLWQVNNSLFQALPSPESKIASPDPIQSYPQSETTSTTPPEVDQRYSPQIPSQPAVSLNLSPIGQASSVDELPTQPPLTESSPPVGPISSAIQSSLGESYNPSDYSNYYSAFYQSHHADPNAHQYFKSLQSSSNHHFTVSSLIQKVNPGTV